ncbi:MAG: GNAT family N-acetyltransferase [Fibrobacterota bacterium]|nr:GNAT family N-acetyltransferase [Fibrobacterota bacterium]QQS05812.1 MAG: GNAT family N-acetyltransferase [Fibrobacterota bacterium]
MGIELNTRTGADLAMALERVVEMRIRLFSEYPYLYVGVPEYEKEYFEAFQAKSGAMVVEALVDGAFAGLATAIPLAQDKYILKPARQLLADAGLDPAALFYLGELLVEPSFQGRGVGSALLEAVRAEGKRLGFAHCCLMAVDRPLDHPSRPRHFGMPVPLWAKAGFRALKGRAFFEYPTRLPGGNVATIPNPMVFWRD